MPEARWPRRRSARVASGESKRSSARFRACWRPRSGYSGGKTDNPTYEDVCSDETGHAEVVEVEYDPAKVSYDQLLEVFWNNHNPTTLNRQGPDVGSQYRSAIFFHTPEQQAAAKASKERLEKSGRFNRPIVTEITPARPLLARRGVPPAVLREAGRRRLPRLTSRLPVINSAAA